MAVNGSEPAFSFVGAERFCSVNDCCDGACNGAGSRIRTDDLLITNQLLYQLSYAGIYEGKLLSFTALSRPIVYAICIRWHKTMTKRAIRSGCHRAPLSAFSFSRQADSLTRLRDSRAVFRRVLRPSSNSPTAFWKHGEALRHVRHKRNPLGEHNRSELDPPSTIRNVFRTFQSWRKVD